MITYYFDNEYLKQYLASNQGLEVFVNKEFLTITDESDIENPKKGVGYNVDGKAQYFNYPAIESIKIDGITFTKEQLNQELNPEETPPPTKDKEEKDPEAKDKKSDDAIEIDPDKNESFKVGEYIINMDPNSIYKNTGGPIERINEELVQYKTYTNGQYITVSCLTKHIIRE